MTHKAFKSLLISSVAISSITLGVSHSAHAQSNDSANSGGIEEIVVVATRREESLQEVPIALSVIGDETIETLKPQSLSDFGGLAPNVNIGEAEATPGGSAIFIRGLGYSEVEKTQNTPVGVMIDGVVLGVNTGQLIDAFDIEQIEISRGPQGIFFGKNTTGGVINVRRTTPTRELGFKGSVAYGSHETVNVKGIFNAPLGNRGGIKLGATYNETDGYTRNIFTDESAGGKEYLGLNAALEYDIADWANIALRYDRMDLEGEGSPLQFGNRLTAGTSAPTCPFPIANPLIPTPNGALHTERPQAYKQFTQELRLAGSALEDRLDYLLGLYYYDHKITARQTTNAFIEQSSLEDNDSLSFFGNLDYQLLDNFTISAGVRTIDESKTFSNGIEADLVLTGLFPPGANYYSTLTGALGIQDGEVTDGILPANRVQGPTGVAGSTGTADFTGTQTGLGRIADYNYNISGTYEFDLGPGTATVNANYNYIDDHALGTGFGQSDIEEGYGLLNAYLGYSFDKYTISLSGKNLTNQDYRHTSLPAVFFQRWGDNSSWLLEFQAEF